MNRYDVNHDFLSVYDQAIKELKSEPDSLVLQHRAVLALARAGALDFAISEYHRFGLDTVRNHEDIMALGGRLLKDQALASTGEQRMQYARESADKYDAAFKDTNGYYSGINAATMSLVAGGPQSAVSDRARAILDLLPETKNLDDEELYFVEATRAEAHLIMGEANKAASILREAIYHDPLNYTAHATTLKQFRMILRMRDEPVEWTRPFTPPKSAHFAGHIFSLEKDALSSHNELSKSAVKDLKVEISETIQSNDIGFGFGALAAGADIMIAEALMAEGAELHVVLPTDEKTFLEKSVIPFGKSWIKRYKACLKKAHSVRILTEHKHWPDSLLGSYSSQVAMGLAVMRAANLSTGMAQLLLWDGKQSLDPMSTASDAQIWGQTNREQISIPYPGKRKPRKNTPVQAECEGKPGVTITLAIPGYTGSEDDMLLDAMKQCTADNTADNFVLENNTVYASFSETDDAARCAIDINNVAREMGSKLSVGGYSGFGAKTAVDQQQDRAAEMAASAPPASTLINEKFAAVLAARYQTDFKVEFAGKSTPNNGHEPIRMFSLQRQIQY